MGREDSGASGNLIDDDGCDDACRLPVCGDGKRAGDEACDEGAANRDRPAFRFSQPSTAAFGGDPIVADESSVEFYGYASASSSTGLEQAGESRVFFEVDRRDGRLALFFSHGRDGDQDDAEVSMDLSGLPLGFTIDVTDDRPSEFFGTSSTSASGRWKFDNNSDGGVIGGLPFPGSWTIVVAPSTFEGIASWVVVRGDGSRVALSLVEPLTIESSSEAGSCRSDCTVPRCGDGRLDGGELCDGDDGCAADCRRFE
jgi:hypothetical protein